MQLCLAAHRLDSKHSIRDHCCKQAITLTNPARARRWPVSRGERITDGSLVHPNPAPQIVPRFAPTVPHEPIPPIRFGFCVALEVQEKSGDMRKIW
jgi:hypothetical protein